MKCMPTPRAALSWEIRLRYRPAMPREHHLWVSYASLTSKRRGDSGDHGGEDRDCQPLPVENTPRSLAIEEGACTENILRSKLWLSYE
jgi:hypothetical protein